MSAKVAPLREAFAACIARERFFSCVNSLVDLKVADAVEAFAAKWADEPFLLVGATRYSSVQLGVVW